MSRTLCAIHEDRKLGSTIRATLNVLQTRHQASVRPSGAPTKAFPLASEIASCRKCLPTPDIFSSPLLLSLIYLTSGLACQSPILELSQAKCIRGGTITSSSKLLWTDQTNKKANSCFHGPGFFWSQVVSIACGLLGMVPSICLASSWSFLSHSVAVYAHITHSL